MPVRPCPECQNPTPRVLDALSAHAQVWYYRCPNCSHIWNVPKADPAGTQTSNVAGTPTRQNNPH